jgi:hypothetical protein
VKESRLDPVTDAIDQLKQVPNITHAYHVMAFVCYRNAKGAPNQRVRVEILDAGPDPALASRRYMVWARSENGKFASGNSADTVQAALALVHWYKLD